MITTQTNKQTNKQTSKQTYKQTSKQKKQTMQQANMTCIRIFLIQGNEKSLMKFAAVSAKTLKTVKCLPKILFNIDIMDLCLLFGLCIFFKRQLQRYLYLK